MAVDQWHPCCRPRDASSGQGWEDPWEALSTGLGSRALVHYSDLDQAPAALTVVDGTVLLHELAAGSTIKDAVTHYEHLAQHVFSPGPTGPAPGQTAECSVSSSSRSLRPSETAKW